MAWPCLRDGKTHEGIVQLEKVQRANPDIPHTWFNLGIIFKKQGETERALPQFERLVRLAPSDAVAHYNLGALYKQSDRIDDAIHEFIAASRLNTSLAAPHFQLYNVYRTLGKREEAERELHQFQQIKQSQEGAAIPEDVEWGDYAEIYDPAGALPPAAPEVPKFRERRIEGKVDPRTAGFAVVDGELMIWSSEGVLARRPGLEKLKSVRCSIAPGDFDNDGRMDLAAVTDHDVQLCHNDKTAFTCKAILSGNFNTAVWLDFDHDYDLDLFVFGPVSRLMRNQGSAGFADHTGDFPFVNQPAIRGDPVRANPDSKTFDLRVDWRCRRCLPYCIAMS